MGASRSAAWPWKAADGSDAWTVRRALWLSCYKVTSGTHVALATMCGIAREPHTIQKRMSGASLLLLAPILVVAVVVVERPTAWRAALLKRPRRIAHAREVEPVRHRRRRTLGWISGGQ